MRPICFILLKFDQKNKNLNNIIYYNRIRSSIKLIFTLFKNLTVITINKFQAKRIFRYNIETKIKIQWALINRAPFCY